MLGEVRERLVVERICYIRATVLEINSIEGARSCAGEIRLFEKALGGWKADKILCDFEWILGGWFLVNCAEWIFHIELAVEAFSSRAQCWLGCCLWYLQGKYSICNVGVGT